MTDDMISAAFDVAALRAKADEVERNFKLLVAMDSVEWPEKVPPTRDDSIQPFRWEYGARELVAEMKRVSQILSLRAKLEKPTDIKDYLAFPMSFQEAFIDSDAMRNGLIDRLHVFFNSNWKRGRGLLDSREITSCHEGMVRGDTRALQTRHVHLCYEPRKPAAHAGPPRGAQTRNARPRPALHEPQANRKVDAGYEAISRAKQR